MSKTQNREEIMVVPTDLLYEVGYFEGLSTDYAKYLSAISNNYIIKERGKVESDPNFNQIIVYAIINWKDSILRYRRSKKNYESRLKNKLSIGIGGHVTLDDINTEQDIFTSCLKREVNEEIQINTQLSHNFVAVLKDDSNSVGTVHFGIIAVIHLVESKVLPKEKTIVECKFIKKEELVKDLKNYEQWSRICINNIDNLLQY